MVARRRFEFYLHRDGCAAAIRVLSTQRSVRRGDLIGMDLYLHRDSCAAENSVLSTQRMLRRGNMRLRERKIALYLIRCSGQLCLNMESVLCRDVCGMMNPKVES